MRPVETTPRATEAGSGTVRLKRALIGRPRASGEMDQTLLSKRLALPIFASDPLSSVAYATEAALVVLVAASATAADLVLPISAGIAVLLAIVVLSYRQTVNAYETSGGAYVVSRDNLGRAPEPCRGRRPARRLRAHGRGLRHRRRARPDVGRALARESQGRALAPLRRRPDPREPPRRPRVRPPLRPAHLRVRRRHVRPGRDRGREVPRRQLPQAPPRPTRSRPASAPSASSSCCAPSPPAPQRSQASRRSRTASAPSGLRSRRTRPGRSLPWA